MVHHRARSEKLAAPTNSQSRPSAATQPPIPYGDNTSMSSPQSGTRPTFAELFDLPEDVGAQDFVLKLADAIRHPDITAGQYVVTKQLANCFDEALSLVRGAIADNKSRAAYLHGSFGTGKSHFMAMLYLLLQGDPHARSHPKLDNSGQ